MYKTIYPKEQQILFTNRERELTILERNFEGKIKDNFCFYGLRKIGKSILMKEFIKRNYNKYALAYIDLENIDTTPEQFSLQYIGTLCSWLCNPQDSDLDSFLKLDSLTENIMYSKSEVAKSTVIKLNQELSKRKLDYQYLVRLALNFPEELQREQGQIIVIIDEFQKVMELNNFKGIDIIPLFRSIIQKQNIKYIVTGSVISLFERVFKNKESPLFLHFKTELLPPLSKSYSLDLVTKLLGHSGIGEKIYGLTQGHPFYIYAICKRILDEDMELRNKDVWRAFIIEVLTKDGRIYNHCNYIFTESLGRARGQATLKLLLRILSRNSGLTLSEIAERANRTPSVIDNLLARLIDVDLVIVKERRYYIRDPILGFWVAKTHEGYTFDYKPDEKALSSLVKKLGEEILKLRTERGMLVESSIRESIRETFKGQIISASLFGSKGSIELSKPGEVKNLRFDGEIDILILGVRNWLCEIKSTRKPANYKDLEKLLKRKPIVEDLEKIGIDRLWFISESGFTSHALKFAGENKILVSDGEDIKKIFLRKNFIVP